jgi:galactofuranose transport system substrate-binding protein
LVVRGQAAPLVVGFSQIGSESGWRSAETKVSKSEAEKAGYHAENRGCSAKTREPNQSNQIIHCARVSMPSSLHRLSPPAGPLFCTEAKEAKIPVFLLDRTIEVSDPSLYTAAVASDSVHEGKVAGDWLVKEVAGKPCNVVELQGTVGASVALNRKKGFADALKAAPPTLRSSARNPVTLRAVKVKK